MAPVQFVKEKRLVALALRTVLRDVVPYEGALRSGEWHIGTCEHTSKLEDRRRLWVTPDDGTIYVGCGGCVLRRTAFHTLCGICSVPLTDDGHTLATVYVGESIALLASICEPCEDIYGDLALLDPYEKLVVV